MNKMKHIFQGLFFILFAVLCQPSIWASAKLQSASLFQGSSMARYSDSSAYLHWSIVNPDAEEAIVVLQLEPDSGASGAIYSNRIRLGANSRLEGRSLVTLGNSERYIVSLIQQNLRVDKNDILLRPTPPNRLNIAVLTDDDDFPGASEISKNESLYRRLQFSNIRHRNAPHHFNGFAIYDLLILHKADLTRYSTFQKTAILDHVRKGGTLVISAAETAFSMQKAGLAELLPYQPLGTLEYEGLDEVRRCFGLAPATPPLRDANGDLLPPVLQTVLEVMTPERSKVLVQQANRPLVCLGQAGLGNLIGLCFDPFLVCKAEPELTQPIWNTLIRYSNYLPQTMQPDGTARVNETLQHLQGYVIPPVSEILHIFLLYVVSAILILGIAFHFKHPALGWCILCIFGLFYTLFIFRKAGRIAVNQPEHSFTAISMTLWDGNQSILSGTGNLFSKTDCRPTITANANRNFFLPQSRSSEHEGGTALAPTPLHITTDWAQTLLERISLQQYRPRTLCWQASSQNHGLDAAVLPQLTSGENGLQLQAWKIPEHLKNAKRAILVLPGGLVPLQLLDGEVTGTIRRFEAMEADLVFLSASAGIRALRLPNPTLCLISTRITEKCDLLGIDNGKEHFSGYNYHLEFIPLETTAPTGNFLIDSAFITIDIPPKSILRQYFRLGEFSDIEGTLQTFPLDFNIHHTFHGCQASEIQIALDISDPSGKTSFKLTLIDLDKRSIEPVRREGNTFFFKPESPVIDPRENKLHAILQQTGKSDSGGGGLSQRVNSWKILSCDVQIHCAKPGF
jgi:hypothetical protein